LVILGLVLAGVMLLLGRGLIHRTEDAPAPASVTQTRPEAPPPAATIAESKPAAPAPEVKRSLLRGSVLDAVTRQAVRKFEIQLQRVNTMNEETPVIRSFQSDAGTFEWENAPVGNWYVTVTAPGYQRFMIEDLEIAADQETRELTVPMLRGYKVTGRVFDESSGAGIAHATVIYQEASGDIGGVRTGHAVSKKNGSFVFEGVPRGRIKLQARSLEHAERQLEIVVSEQTPPVEIGLASGGAIAGFVVTAGGAPVAAAVALINEQNFSQIQRTTDNGAFSFDHLAPGRYRVATGMVGAQEIVLAQGERREGIVLTAQSQGRSVRGTVTGLPREELEQAFAIVHSATRNARAMRPLDARGEFVLNGLPPGPAELRIELSASSRTLQKSIEVPADKDLVVDIEFAAGVRLSGRVTQGDKPVGAGKKVSMNPLPRKQGISYRGQTAADGTYRIEGVAAGQYEVSAAAGANRVIRISGEDAVLDLEIPVAQIAGRVIEGGGSAPVVGANVYATPVGTDVSRIRPYALSDHFGQFKLTGVEPGAVVVSAYKRGYELFRERIVYAAPITDLTIALRPASGVEIKAHRADTGAAVRDLHVTEYIEAGAMGIVISMQLDEDGVGSLPKGLAGSTLLISIVGRDLVVREWDGQPLDLQFR
jgi:hypothetical protein